MKNIEGIDEAWRLLQPRWTEIEAEFNKHNERFLRLASTDYEAIGRVVRAHLLVENFIDTHLEETLKIKNIAEARLTFAQKIKLLPAASSGAAFVRPGILQLNSVRNKLGHRVMHEVEHHEISAIYEALAIGRSGVAYDSPVLAIEAFAPMVCAFLSVSTPDIQQLFRDAFAKIKIVPVE